MGSGFPNYSYVQEKYLQNPPLPPMTPVNVVKQAPKQPQPSQANLTPVRVDVTTKSVRDKSPKYNPDIAVTDKKWTDTFSTEFHLRSEIDASTKMRIE